MEESRHERFLRELMSDDTEFYNKFLSKLSDEEMQRFLEKNPDFLKE